MRILVAGATGALEAQLVPRLLERGHEVSGMARDASRCDAIRGLGATPVIADALDGAAVGRAVAQAPHCASPPSTASRAPLGLDHEGRLVSVLRDVAHAEDVEPDDYAFVAAGGSLHMGAPPGRARRVGDRAARGARSPPVRVLLGFAVGGRGQRGGSRRDAGLCRRLLRRDRLDARAHRVHRGLPAVPRSTTRSRAS